MQDDNAMNGTQSEISKLKADLAQAEKDRDYWRETARSARKAEFLRGKAGAMLDIADNLHDMAVEAWASRGVIRPEEIRDMSGHLRTQSYSISKEVIELDRIASESAE